MSNQICRNCGHTVEGLYCSNCGQKNDVERLKWSSLADNFLSTFVGDGAIGERRSNVRYGFLQTILVTVIHPGQTVSEYLEGHRRKYFNPVTILLMLSGFYALVGVFFGLVDDTPKPSANALGEYINIFKAYSRSHPAIVYLLLLPFTALAYKWVFRKRSDLRYIEFAYVGIFAAIFSMVLLFLELPFRSEALSKYDNYATAITLVAQGWFTVTVFRALFQISIKRAVWSWLRTFIISYLLLVVVSFLLTIIVLVIYSLIDPEAMGRISSQLFEEADSVEVVNQAARDAAGALREGVDSLKTK